RRRGRGLPRQPQRHHGPAPDHDRGLRPGLRALSAPHGLTSFLARGRLTDNLFSKQAMLASTFRLLRGVGPAREQRLWRQGIGCWADLLDGAASGLPRATDGALRAAVRDAQDARARGDAERLARMLPP